MLQTLNFPAGGRQIDAKASFFRYEGCNAGGGDESLRVRADGNDLGVYLPGDYVDLPVVATRWEVTPITPTATGSVRLGMGQVGSSRLTGTVRVIDSAADKTRAGLQFLGSTIVAANPAFVGLLNITPQAGKTVVLKALALQSGTAGDMWIATGTANGTATPVGTVGPRNKLIGGPSAACLYSGGLAALSAPTAGEAPGYSAFCRVYVPASQVTPVPFTTPIVLPPGFLLIVNGNVINRDVSAVFDIEEI